MATSFPIRPKGAVYMRELFVKHGTKEDSFKILYKALSTYLKAMETASSNYKKATTAAGKKLDLELDKLKKQK